MCPMGSSGLCSHRIACLFTLIKGVAFGICGVGHQSQHFLGPQILVGRDTASLWIFPTSEHKCGFQDIVPVQDIDLRARRPAFSLSFSIPSSQALGGTRFSKAPALSSNRASKASIFMIQKPHNSLTFKSTGFLRGCTGVFWIEVSESVNALSTLTSLSVQRCLSGPWT